MHNRSETIKREFIRCPICSSNDYEKIYEKTYKLWIDNYIMMWPSEQVICKNCGIIFTNPQPTKDTLEWLYANDMQEYGDEIFTTRISASEFLNRFIVKEDNISIFDIGASRGDFLNIMRRLGYIVDGIEISNWLIGESLKKYNIKLWKGTFDLRLAKSINKKYDVVTAMNVLEHTKNPLKFIKAMIEINKDNGYVYIEVPDTDRPLAENIADYFSNQHIMHHTENSLKNIATVLGLEIVATDKPKDIAVIRIILKNTAGKKNEIVNNFKKNRKILENYKIRRKKFINSIRKKLNGIKNVIIYGAGMHTSQLIFEELLGNIEIESIIDSNSSKWSKNFFGFSILSPDTLKNASTPVLISSYDSQEEISNFLSKNYPNIKQIKLYDKVVSYNKGMQEFLLC